MAEKKKQGDQTDRLDYYKPHPEPLLSDEEIEKVHVWECGSFFGFTVWLIDGEFVRDFVDVDFVEGGNPGRYHYVPEGEIWIEDNLDVKDYVATLVHEWYECFLMQNNDESYSDAHDAAADLERDVRKLEFSHDEVRSLVRK